MADTKTFRHKLTGLVGTFPTVFGELFHEVLEEVEGDAPSPAPVTVVPEIVVPPAVSDPDNEGSDK